MIANVERIREMDKYIDDVCEGRQVVGELVRLAVERHVRDMERIDDDSFPFYFDRQKANQAIESFPVLFRHSIGNFAGLPFVLSPWQTFIIGSIFGWRAKEDPTTRRFRRAYCTMARKQGKSTLAAGVCLLLAGFDNEAVAQVFIGATKKEQARVIFDEAQRMVVSSPVIRDMAENRVGHIAFGDSIIKTLGSDKPFSGLNPSCVVFDELHEWKEQHRKFYDTLTTGSAVRKHPLRFTITTAGDSKSQIWKEEENVAEKVVRGEFEDESYFVFMARLDKDDDPFDESNWIKSMPNIDIMCLDEPRNLARESEVSPVAKHRFMQYFANVEVSPIEQAIDPAEWDKCKVDLSDWSKADVVCGAIDAGGRNDLGAIAMVARFTDGVDDDGKERHRYEVRTREYMDVDTTRDLTEQPWAVWVDTGKVEVTPIIYTRMRDDLAMHLEQYGGRQIGFDPWNTQQMAEELQSSGFECVKISQNRFNLHEPLTLLMDLITKRKVSHDGSSPILRWAIENLLINSDSNGRWMPDRKNSKDKIDPVVAVIMALRLASLAPARARGSLFIA